MLAAILLLLALSPQERSAVPAPEPEGTLPTFPVELEFHTRDSYGQDASIVLGVEVALGVGLDGASPLFVDAPELARATSDEDGLVRVTLDVPLTWRDIDAARVWVRVEKPGHCRYTFARTFDRTYTLTQVSARPGGTLFGSVRDPEGEPVAGAGVYIVHGDSNARSTATVSDGRFAVFHGPQATRYALHASARGVGSATVELDLDPWVVPDEVSLTLEPGLPLRGRLIDAQGAPVAGMHVLALPMGSSEVPRGKELLELERGGGVAWDRTITNGSGRFLLPALAAGEYRLLGAWARGDLTELSPGAQELWGSRFLDRESSLLRHLVRSQELLGTARPSADEEAVLVTHRPRLEVRVLEATGEPARTVRVDGSRIRSPLGVVQLVDGQVTPERIPMELPYLREWNRAYLDDRVVVPLEPGSAGVELLVSWSEPGVPYRELRVPTTGQLLQTVTLQLGPRGDGTAGIDVRVVDPEGQDFESPVIQVFAAESGREVSTTLRSGWAIWPTIRGARWKPELPPGRYLVQASSRYVFTCVVPRVFPRTPHCAARAEVEVRPGERTALQLRFSPGGHVDFTAEAALPTIPHRPTTREQEAVLRELGAARVELVREGHEPLAIEFELPGTMHYNGDLVLPHRPARGLTPIPPGRWTLRVLSEAGPILERTVEIEAGKTTTVAW